MRPAPSKRPGGPDQPQGVAPRPSRDPAHLALLLGVALERALRRAGVVLALDTALEALRPVRLVTLELGGHQTRVITKPTPHAQAILKAVGLPRLVPPEPCSEIA